MVINLFNLLKIKFSFSQLSIDNNIGKKYGSKGPAFTAPANTHKNDETRKQCKQKN
jgi:hypothetical protein